MNVYVLDTDHISLYEKSHPGVTPHVRSIDSQQIAVTVSSAEKQLRGWFDAIRKDTSGEHGVARHRTRPTKQLGSPSPPSQL